MISAHRNRQFFVWTFLVVIGLISIIGSSKVFADTPTTIANNIVVLADTVDTVEAVEAVEPDTSIENTDFNSNHRQSTQSADGDSPVKSLDSGFPASLWLALLFVLAIIFIAAWLIRKAYPGGNMLFGSLPIVQILGRTHLGPKQVLVMTKVDSKLLLLGMTDHQITPLMTIDNPEDVSRLITMLEQTRPIGIANSFKHFFTRETQEIQQQEQFTESFFENSSNNSHNKTENEVLLLKNEVNSLINKVHQLKGIGGQDSSG